MTNENRQKRRTPIFVLVAVGRLIVCLRAHEQLNGRAKKILSRCVCGVDIRAPVSLLNRVSLALYSSDV